VNPGYRVMGVDPGLANLGIGVVMEVGSRVTTLHTELVTTRADQQAGERLHAIHEALTAVIAANRPDALALEEQFFHQQRDTALKVAQAIGVVLLAAHTTGTPVHRYGPLEVKQALVGSGRADKRQVAFMVESICRPGGKEAHHVTDALALALTHLSHRRLRRAIGTR
jgi:crossover junction endodeoxyribonuclease RuvC